MVNDNKVDLHQVAATVDKPEERATEDRKNELINKYRHKKGKAR